MDSLLRHWTLASSAATTSATGLRAAVQPLEIASNQDKSAHTNHDHSLKQQQQQQQPEHQDDDAATATGAEWIFVEEPTGFFFPKMQKRRQLFELDQVRHVLHYGHYRRVMRIHDISLVTSVEEVAADGQHQWWMTVQDVQAPQVWVLHFASRERLALWVTLLRAVVCATAASAVVSDIVQASTLDRHSRRRSSVALVAVACHPSQHGDVVDNDGCTLPERCALAALETHTVAHTPRPCGIGIAAS